ncbi:effector-associated constant component EACC1 [Streptomyces rubiginosohelvolus]|uniref:effector-associated constant component EACC1 n=1 Tax=Streptomyces rubiginosohelvolus TaxID=67362 RepID=UPI0036ADEF66
MELMLQVDEVVGGESEALLRWLHQEEELRGRARMSAREADIPGAMGGFSLDILDVVLSNSIALTSLAATVLAWRSSRPAPAPSVRFEVNGVAVTVDTDDPETVRSLIETLRSAGSDAGTAADEPGSTTASGS